MKPPTLAQQESIARLGGHRDGKVLLEYLQEWLAQSTTQVVQCEEIAKVHKYQGEVMVLRYLIERFNVSEPLK